MPLAGDNSTNGADAPTAPARRAATSSAEEDGNPAAPRFRQGRPTRPVSNPVRKLELQRGDADAADDRHH
jgi:hypothetical protein